MALRRNKPIYLTGGNSPDNVFTRRRVKSFTPEQSIQLAKWRLDAVNPSTPPKQREALEKWIKHYETGRLGHHSDLFLRRGPIEARIGKLSQTESQTVEQLPQAGAGGALLYALGKYGFGGHFIRRKRSDVLKALELHIAAKPSSFKTLVFATARLMEQNHSMRGGVLHDREIEPAIMGLFGKMAEKSGEYNKKYPRAERQALVDYGQQYFRHLVREELLSEFSFLNKQHQDPTKMKAFRYALIGGEIDNAAEETDVKRINFITTIFEKDIPEINRFHNMPKRKDRALQAIIRVRWKAMKSVGTHEAIKFFYQLCDHYKITPRQIDNYAIGLYWGRERIKPVNNPSRGKMTKEQRDRQEIDSRTAHAREKELKERILDIYGEEILEKYKPGKKTQKEESKIIIPATARFELENKSR